MEWMLLPLKRYADFQGRSRRMEYWMFVLGYAIVFIVLALLAGLLGAFSGGLDPNTGRAALGAGFWLMISLFGILGLALLVPTIAVQVRRLHDQNLSGWLVLIGYIPIVNYIGGIVLLVFMCLPGTKGPNKYGPDPLDPNGANVADVFR
jgi:uncharacterized membrane protein YhaH (DUF805 family)